MNYFETLNSVNCNDITEQKNDLTYLSWAHAWKELKKLYPKSYYTVYQNELEWNYFSDGRYCWVKTGVTVVTDEFEIEHIEYLPVLDYRNKSIPADMVSSFDVNKSIQRSLTKAVARHGLGLYIYAGEDLPDEADGSVDDRKKAAEADAKIKKARPESDKSQGLMKELLKVAMEKGYTKDDICGIAKVDDLTTLTDKGLEAGIDFFRKAGMKNEESKQQKSESV